MKTNNLLLMLIALFGLLRNSNAQSGQNGQIRAAVYAPADNTGRSLNYIQIATPTVKTTTDTAFLVPYGYDNIIQPSDSLLQKVVFVIQTKPTNYVGDVMRFVISGSKAVKKDTIEFRNKYNTSFKFKLPADSTIIFLGGKSYYGSFEFNGTYWNEQAKDTIAR